MTEAPEAMVVLLSGGVDSSVLIRDVARNLAGCSIHALSFHYGQRHARELDCARKQAVSVGAAQHHVVDISFLGALLREGSALLQGGAAVPDLADVSERDRAQPPTYVPNRNMVLLSMAAAYAETHHIQDVFYGAHAQDEYGYWDCTRDFLARMNAVLALNRGAPVTIHAPFLDKSKAEMLRLGFELGVDFAQTWSCYRGGGVACGTCPTCVERLNAFEAAGRADPLPYAAR